MESRARTGKLKDKVNLAWRAGIAGTYASFWYGLASSGQIQYESMAVGYGEAVGGSIVVPTNERVVFDPSLIARTKRTLRDGSAIVAGGLISALTSGGSLSEGVRGALNTAAGVVFARGMNRSLRNSSHANS